MKTAPNRKKLTQTSVLALRPGTKRELIWDERTAGFGVAVEEGAFSVADFNHVCLMVLRSTYAAGKARP